MRQGSRSGDGNPNDPASDWPDGGGQEGRLAPQVARGAIRRKLTTIARPAVVDVRPALVAAFCFPTGATSTTASVDVHTLRQQAGGQIGQGEQPTSTIQRRDS